MRLLPFLFPWNFDSEIIVILLPNYEELLIFYTYNTDIFQIEFALELISCGFLLHFTDISELLVKQNQEDHLNIKN